MPAGGKREGAGRKPKVEEQELVEKLSPLMPQAFKALKNALDNQDQWAVKLAFEYYYGKPKQSTDITSKGGSINIPIVNFIESQ